METQQPGCRLKRSDSVSCFLKPATLGAPLTRSYSVSTDVNLGRTFNFVSPPNWAFYHYSSPNYRSLWPYKTWSDRYFTDYSLYDKYNAFPRIYKPIPLHRPFSHYSKHPSMCWTVSYDYVYDFDEPSRLYSGHDPFYDEWKRYDRYRSRFLDNANNPRFFYKNKRSHFY